MHISLRKEIWRDGLGRTGIVILSAFAVLAIAAPFVASDPAAVSGSTLCPPSGSHLLGTNDVGQDIWSRLVFSARTSLVIALGAGLLSTALSFFLGAGAAVAGGVTEQAVMRLADAFLILPGVVVMIVISAWIQPGTLSLILMIALFHWQGGARIIRSRTLSLIARTHIRAARACGAGRWYLIRRHILPELVPILMVSFIFSARAAVFLEAGLAFIGISGPQRISWGIMIHHAMKFTYLPAWKWWLIPSGAAVSLLILGLVFTGHAMEKCMDPRLRDA